MGRPERVWQSAIVIEDRSRQWLEFPAISTCARCRSGKGCGAGVFGVFFAGRKARLAMPLTENWRPGDAVRVGVSARQLMLASMALYLFPLLCFMLGAIIAHFWLAPNHDGWALLLGIVCAFVGLMIIRKRGWHFSSLVIEPMPVDPEASQSACESQVRS